MKKFYSFFLVAVCLFATSFAYAATRTVYFQDNKNWANQGTGIQIYMWNSVSGNNTGWDNESNIVTELVSGSTYKYEITNDDWDKVIFHTVNGYGKFQTANLDIRNNGIYSQEGDKGNLVQIYFDDFNSKWGNISLQNWDNNGVNAVSLPTNGDIYSWLVLENSWFLFHYNNYQYKTADVNGTDKIYYYTEYGADSSFPLNLYAMGTVYPRGTYEFLKDGSVLGGGAVAELGSNDGSLKCTYVGEGKYTLDNMELYPVAGENYARFSFHTALNEDQTQCGDIYGSVEDETLELGIAESLNQVKNLTNENANEFKVKTELTWYRQEGEGQTGFGVYRYYNYLIDINLFNNTITFKVKREGGITGVESISVEDSVAPVEYFNLQGVRVENPENGLYIVRQGNKVSKQLIR